MKDPGGGGSGGAGGVSSLTPPPKPFEHVPAEIAVIGYAATSGACMGYARAGGRKMNTTGYFPNVSIGGVASGNWHVPEDGDRSDLWSSFIEPQFGNVTQKVWWMCVMTDDEWRNTGTPDKVRQRLDEALSRIREFTPLPIFASPVPHLVGCKSIQDVFSDAVKVQLDEMVDEGLLIDGPALSDLGKAQLINRCHPNAQGEQVWGAELLDFFG